MNKRTDYYGFALGLLFIFLVSIFLAETFSEPDYTIQDVYNWCCDNVNESISPTGENCSAVIENIYSGDCYGK